MVPTGAGVSSSSAMVCACSLAVLAAYNIPAAKAEVADFACQAERYVGVTSGGMDQAISMMGAPGLAKFIEFNPVRCDTVLTMPFLAAQYAHAAGHVLHALTWEAA